MVKICRNHPTETSPFEFMFIPWPCLWILYIPTRFRSSLKWQSSMFTGCAPSDSPDSHQTKHDTHTSPLKTASMKNISKKNLCRKTWGSITQSEFDIDTNKWCALDSLKVWHHSGYPFVKLPRFISIAFGQLVASGEPPPPKKTLLLSIILVTDCLIRILGSLQWFMI